MAKDDTTVLKTRLAQKQDVDEISTSTLPRGLDAYKADPEAVTVSPTARTQTVVPARSVSTISDTVVASSNTIGSDKISNPMVDEDPLAHAPTLARLISEPTLIAGDTLFTHLDKQISEQYADKTVFNRRFVLLDLLGAGGMGNVYLAIDLIEKQMTDGNPHIAVKVLNDSCKRMPGALQALQEEAQKAKALSHPNIVRVFDFAFDLDADGETAFITMEYIEGCELKDLIRKSRVSQAKAMIIIDRVARGLAYAHQQRFVHSDIKPANIFYALDGSVKILDFGIAKVFNISSKEVPTQGSRLTDGAHTPAYASLEVLLGYSPHPADDVYSLSVVAYELLSGHHPFPDEKGFAIPADKALLLGLKPHPIHGLSRRHMNALKKGLAFKRKDRFQDAGEVIDAFKPRSFKKEIVLLAVAVIVTVVIMFSGSQALDKVVPKVDSLKVELAEVAITIGEADGFIDSGDIDYAHRLYSQAWTLANDLTVNDLDERDKVRAILSDRMDTLSDILIDQSKSEKLDEFELRELLLALEFLLQDEMTDNKKAIARAIEVINKRL